MDEQMQAQPAEGAPEGGDPTEALMQMGEALNQLGGAIIGAKSVAPEAQKALQASVSAYQDFLSIMGGGQAGPSSQPEMTAGRGGAVPADMPSGRNMKAVPA